MAAAAAAARGRPNEEAGPPRRRRDVCHRLIFRTLRPRHPPLVFIGREGGKR